MLVTASGQQIVSASRQLVQVLADADPVLPDHGLTVVCTKCGGTPRPEYVDASTTPTRLNCGCRSWIIRA